jgi:hypothetical protein
MTKAITVWSVYRDDAYHHNHIEDGHVDGDKPVPRFPSQRGWTSRGWRKTFAYLVDGKVVRS